MEKTITIDGKEIRLNNNVAWTMEYKDQFNKDVVPVIMPLMASIVETLASVISETDTKQIGAKEIAESITGRTMEVMLPMYQVEFVDLIVNITWAMAKCADEDIPEPKKWARQFDNFPLDVLVPEVYDLVIKGFTSSKNWDRLGKIGEKIKHLQP